MRLTKAIFIWFKVNEIKCYKENFKKIFEEEYLKYTYEIEFRIKATQIIVFKYIRAVS